MLWGLYYGVLLLAEKLLLGRLLDRLPAFLRWALTFVLVNLGWVLFSITDLQSLLAVLRIMFAWQPFQWRAVLAADASVCSKLLSIPAGLLFSFPVLKKLETRETGLFWTAAVNIGYLALFGVCVLFIVSSSFTPFLYFNF